MEEERAPIERRVAKALAHASGRVSLLVEADGTIAWVSQSVESLLGYRPDELVGIPLFDLYDPEHAEFSRRGFLAGARSEDLSPPELARVPRTAQVRARSGAFVAMESFPTPFQGDGDIEGVLIEWRPVSDRSHLVEAINGLALGRTHQEVLLDIVELVSSMIFGLDVGVLRWQGGAWTPVLNAGRRDPSRLVPFLPPLGDAVWQTGWLRLRDELTEAWAGEGRGVALVPLRTASGAVLGALVLVRERIDSAQRVVTTDDTLLHVALSMATLALADAQTRAELREAAERDTLTNLFNRAGLNRRVAELAERGAWRVGLLYIDLDDFKPVNDAHGHRVGDAVLAEVGRRILDAVRPDDLVCRIGGDEFAILGSGRVDSDQLAEMAGRVRDAISRPISHDGLSVQVGASVGVAIGNPADLTGLLERADVALYQAKRQGKARVVLAA